MQKYCLHKSIGEAAVYQSTYGDLGQNIATCKINYNKFAYIIFVSDVCINKTEKIMKTYPKELIEEFNETPLYICTRCGHTESEIPRRGTGCGDWYTPDGDEEYCPKCEGKETMVEATIEDYICLLAEQGIDINDYN